MKKGTMCLWNMKRLLCCLWLVIFWIPASKQDVSYTQSVDMEGSGCDHQGAYQISDSDVVQVFASPPQLPVGEGTRDSCTVELRTTAGRRLRIYLMDLVIYDCGTIIKIFDAEQQLVSPRWTLNCKMSPGTMWTSSYNRVVIRLEKQTPQALNFKYSIALTTTEGPVLDFEQANQNWYQEILSEEAKVGIGVAAAIVLLAIILLIIFLVVKIKKRQKQEAEMNATSKAGSTSYSQATFPSFASRHYTHDDSQDFSSNDSQYNLYRNKGYKEDSPQRDVKSILKTERKFNNAVYETEPVDTSKVAVDKKASKGFFYRQSRSGSTRSLDKPHIEHTDISDVEVSDREKRAESKRRRSEREMNSNNERNEARARNRSHSRTRSEKSRHHSEYDREPDVDQNDGGRHRSRDPDRRRTSERTRDSRHYSEHDYTDDRDGYRDRERERNHRSSEREPRERSRGQSRTDSARRERDRSYSPRRNGTVGRSNSRSRANSRSGSQSKYSTFGRHKTPSTGGRSASSDGSRRHRSSERSGRHRSASTSSRNGRSERHSRRDYY